MSRNTEQKSPNLYDLLSASMDLDQKILQYLRHSDERRNEVFAMMLNKNTRPQKAAAPSAIEQLDNHLEKFFRSKFPNLATTNNITSESRNTPNETTPCPTSSIARPLRGNTYIPDQLTIPDVPKVTRNGKKKKTDRYAYIEEGRDIKAFSDGSMTLRDQIISLIAYLFTETMERQVGLSELIVEDAFEKLMNLAESVESNMIASFARKKNTSRLRALKSSWSTIYSSIRSKFTIMLEKKAYEDLGLQIGRCDETWAAKRLLQYIVDIRVNTEGLQSISTIQQYEDVMNANLNKRLRSIYKSIAKSSAPPPLVIPANDRESSDENNEDDIQVVDQVTRKRPDVEEVSAPNKKYARLFFTED